ncbi:tryptophan--tRNA ligase, partial [Candidatus Uhrbacteria bacterium]|nr:tryptophan--tRNA ligase [Candidatus Uhrbacteria bacterium]
GRHIKDIEKDFEGQGYGEFKAALGDAIVTMLAPIQKKLDEYKKDPSELTKLLDKGRDAAQEIACQKMCVVRERVGIGR